jgi:GNAT superfamily N-acetyltransferase
MEWHEEPIAARHDRKRFRSGAPDLDIYLARYARQNHGSGGALTFVAVPEPGDIQILGYYSIAPGAIAHADVPPSVTRGLGRYPVPVFRLGRLAVDERYQGEGLVGDLLLAAAKRALAAAAQAGGVALAIDAIDERAVGWYARFGAVPLLDDPLHLILPLATVTEALEQDGAP